MLTTLLKWWCGRVSKSIVCMPSAHLRKVFFRALLFCLSEDNSKLWPLFQTDCDLSSRSCSKRSTRCDQPVKELSTTLLPAVSDSSISSWESDKDRRSDSELIETFLSMFQIRTGRPLPDCFGPSRNNRNIFRHMYIRQTGPSCLTWVSFLGRCSFK